MKAFSSILLLLISLISFSAQANNSIVELFYNNEVVTIERVPLLGVVLVEHERGDGTIYNGVFKEKLISELIKHRRSPKLRNLVKSSLTRIIEERVTNVMESLFLQENPKSEKLDFNSTRGELAESDWTIYLSAVEAVIEAGER